MRNPCVPASGFSFLRATMNLVQISIAFFLEDTAYFGLALILLKMYLTVVMYWYIVCGVTCLAMQSSIHFEISGIFAKLLSASHAYSDRFSFSTVLVSGLSFTMPRRAMSLM